jgi:rhodanese-related sulfurtransferase
MKLVRQIGFLCLLSAVPALLSAAFHPHRPPWNQETLAPGEVTLTTAEGWGAGTLWVDARPVAAYEAGHAPGAVHLDLVNWETDFPKFLDRWQPGQRVLVYCSAASCHLAEEIAERLRQSRIEPVFVLKGGWETWREHHPNS